jgi:SpoVK/Ycf46/Vps4 family AAA+-type ATPase
MVGMEDLKTNIVDQILYFAQDLHKGSNGDFTHTVIYGPPGTGKTEIAKIMGKIYSKLGVLSKGTFKKVTRTDLIAGFLGQTAIKTKEVIKECIGGVLFIDEAYALGNTENKDIFSKECIDTLCEALSNHKHELMVIIAGYEKELNECFFRCNQGLDSRFTWRFKTDEYSADNLRNIFIKKVNENGWTIEDTSVSVNWFKKNMVYFKFFGRDMETLLAKVKISHGRRVFCKPETEKKKITMVDMENGFKMYLKNDNVKNRKDSENMKQILSSLYA